MRSVSASLATLDLAGNQITSVQQQHVQFPENQTEKLSIDLSGNNLQTFPKIEAPGGSTVSIDMDSNPGVICGEGIVWALEDER